MTETLQSVFLAIIQGLTEFLPISSSAHLLLPSQLFGWPDQGLAFDVAVHLGSLFAVLWYFRQDVISLATAWSQHLFKQQKSEQGDLAWLVILATVPAGLAGLLLDDFIEGHLRTALVIATTTLVFGLLLGWADRYHRSASTVSKVTLKIALIIGLAQMLAIVPGTSRSGITMTAALFCGLSRETSARFSFYLSIPIIAAAGLLKGGELLLASTPVDWLLLGEAMLVSGLVAYLCIAVFMRLIERIGFMPFVIYRCVLSAIIFISFV